MLKPFIIAVAVSLAGCSSTPAARTVETDLCEARAGGALDPKPGSARAKLEAAEDALCAIVPLTAPPTPPESDAGK
jgi:hypothetical protein